MSQYAQKSRQSPFKHPSLNGFCLLYWGVPKTDSKTPKAVQHPPRTRVANRKLNRILPTPTETTTFAPLQRILEAIKHLVHLNRNHNIRAAPTRYWGTKWIIFSDRVLSFCTNWLATTISPLSGVWNMGIMSPTIKSTGLYCQMVLPISAWNQASIRAARKDIATIECFDSRKRPCCITRRRRIGFVPRLRLREGNATAEKQY